MDSDSLLQRESEDCNHNNNCSDKGYCEPHRRESLNDLLEDNVDERYYLSEEMVGKLVDKPTEGMVRQVGFVKKSENGTQHQSNTVYDPNYAARTLTACDYKNPMMIRENK